MTKTRSQKEREPTKPVLRSTKRKSLQQLPTSTMPPKKRSSSTGSKKRMVVSNKDNLERLKVAAMVQNGKEIFGDIVQAVGPAVDNIEGLQAKDIDPKAQYTAFRILAPNGKVTFITGNMIGRLPDDSFEKAGKLMITEMLLKAKDIEKAELIGPGELKQILVDLYESIARTIHFCDDKTTTYNCGRLIIRESHAESHYSAEGMKVKVYDNKSGDMFDKNDIGPLETPKHVWEAWRSRAREIFETKNMKAAKKRKSGEGEDPESGKKTKANDISGSSSGHGEAAASSPSGKEEGRPGGADSTSANKQGEPTKENNSNKEGDTKTAHKDTTTISETGTTKNGAHASTCDNSNDQPIDLGFDLGFDFAMSPEDFVKWDYYVKTVKTKKPQSECGEKTFIDSGRSWISTPGFSFTSFKRVMDNNLQGAIKGDLFKFLQYTRPTNLTAFANFLHKNNLTVVGPMGGSKAHSDAFCSDFLTKVIYEDDFQYWSAFTDKFEFASM